MNQREEMICYHHNDLDGRCAGAIVLKRYTDCRMREIDYKDDPIFKEEIQINEQVFIVDFSFKPDKLRDLFLVTEASNVIWIDHHETAKSYDYYDSQLPVSLKGLRDFSQECKKSGAELTWEYLFSGEIPEAVRLIGDYDCWRFDTKEKTNLFQQGVRTLNTDPNMFYWKTLLSYDAGVLIAEIIKDGEAATRYRDIFCDKYLKSFSWELEFEGFRCLAMNLAMMGSQGFGLSFNGFDILSVMSIKTKNGKYLCILKILMLVKSPRNTVVEAIRALLALFVTSCHSNLAMQGSFR